MDKPKLVRDKIPEIIKKDNKNPITHIADDKEYWDLLKEKLQEEIDEFIKDENKEEFADVLEVLYAVSDFKEWNFQELEQLRKEKSDKRGKFKDKIILDKVE